MIILPAIDLKNGCCVRLRQGRADDAIVYSDDPVAMALKWQGDGARYLHVVDLDGAFGSAPAHTEVIREIARALDIPVEVGGGLRGREDAATLIGAGVRRVIFGTRAVTNPETIRDLVGEFGDAIAVGIDARDGRVQVRGWVETTETTAIDLARRVAEMGVRTIIYTDTARDGMLGGVNAAAMDAMCAAVGCGVIASGGVSAVADVRTLAGLKRDNLVGAIVGKALYEGRATLAELNAAAG
ncbi:MAG: 1-(5-phosphoribosyl)-5-[(5-phosphoribosylamino)methylideneamino]imidazole-4-carboxamide isomerase [Lentisphaerae bacterium]|nr:1-(5-phosphoribosyl)-5-[(5-phosphoribosylamino)methylideneamino]imidazole-4-carboxamide isomerase [Lentisphaerota bacterium]